MEKKGSSFILLIIVAFLSLALAILVGYLFIVNGNTKTTVETTQKETTKVPAEKDLASISVFEGKKYFNVKSATDNRIAVVQVAVGLKYYKVVKKINVEELLTGRMSEIGEAIGSYFMNVTLEDIKKPETKVKVKSDLKVIINDILSRGEKEKLEIVYMVVFDDWFYQ